MRRSACCLALLLLAACSGDVQPQIVAGLDVCNECNMVIDRPDQAGGFIEQGTFVTFDSPLCLLRAYEKRLQDGKPLPEQLYLADHADATLHPVEAMTFLLTDHAATVMESGTLCFVDRAAAEAAIAHDDERISDWEGYRLAHGTPDRMIEVTFEPTGQIPELVEASKGELVVWMATSSGLDRDLVISIKGYPEVERITIPASGEPVVFRMKADRPGMGFPVVEADTDAPLGMLRVHGSHTADEEAS
ncbi:MAG: hypothetical protein GTN89_02780 [Acidobacteria bacterium]|nr:hypothetical protein [Acidobacteriota bacterium]NIM62504.1 hypothetical protein [Acidobacteriota bacterium]NIO60575.1 hypothetical protein [Acidobacteriota bacterium]NIQ29310.1 hypothetical protein [Acidobacteriota bacterium]NIQ83910.1 hypothetical protein [Acidobacteriota bacterium]